MLKQDHKSFRGFRTPGIRLSEDLLPDVLEHNTERVLNSLYAVHKFDKAHLVMLAEEQLIPRDDAVAMLKTLRSTESDGFEKARLESGGGMHSAEYLLIRALTEEVGGRIHLGRSSGDLGATSQFIPLRDKLLDVMEGILAVRQVIIDVAAKHIDTIMPGYTHGQSAQPVTLGHQLTSWALALDRNFERALQAFDRINVSPAGAAIMTGSDFALNRERTAELLGFSKPIENTFDAILSHDRLLDAFCVLALLNNDMARWADDLMLWSTSEFGIVEVPDRFCGTSSIMMQKKNPYAPQYMKGLSAASIGSLVTAFVVEKGPTGMPIVDRQYSTDAIWKVFADTVRDLKWLATMLPALDWKKDRMEELAGRYWAQATDIAGALVREKNMPWRTAHQIVGILVRLGYERGFEPKEVTPALLDEASQLYMGEPANLSEAALQKALDPRHFVESRTIFGGPAPNAVKTQLQGCSERLERDEELYQERRTLVDSAAAKLEAAIDDLINHA